MSESQSSLWNLENLKAVRAEYNILSGQFESLRARNEVLNADNEQLTDQKQHFEDLANNQVAELEGLHLEVAACLPPTQDAHIAHSVLISLLTFSCLQISSLTEELEMLNARQAALRESNDQANSQLVQMELLSQQMRALEDQVRNLTNEKEVNATQAESNRQCSCSCMFSILLHVDSAES